MRGGAQLGRARGALSFHQGVIFQNPEFKTATAVAQKEAGVPYSSVWLCPHGAELCFIAEGYFAVMYPPPLLPVLEPALGKTKTEKKDKQVFQLMFIAI